MAGGRVIAWCTTPAITQPSGKVWTFDAIANCTQELDISCRIASTHCQRDNVVKLKFLIRSAFDALSLISLPDKNLHVVWNRLSTPSAFVNFKRCHRTLQFTLFSLLFLRDECPNFFGVKANFCAIKFVFHHPKARQWDGFGRRLNQGRLPFSFPLQLPDIAKCCAAAVDNLKRFYLDLSKWIKVWVAKGIPYFLLLGWFEGSEQPLPLSDPIAPNNLANHLTLQHAGISVMGKLELLVVSHDSRHVRCEFVPRSLKRKNVAPPFSDLRDPAANLKLLYSTIREIKRDLIQVLSKLPRSSNFYRKPAGPGEAIKFSKDRVGVVLHARNLPSPAESGNASLVGRA